MAEANSNRHLARLVSRTQPNARLRGGEITERTPATGTHRLRTMGTADGKLAQKFGDIVAVCDVDAGRLDVATRQFKGSKGYADFREVADLPHIDAVINATPDHWHTLVNARLIRSGKDVYGEKPLTLTIDEGKRLIQIVRGSKQILQVGSQQRSDKTFRLACELVRNGRLGKILRVRTWLPTGLREGPFQTAPVPKELNWDVWQGQTAAVEYVPQRCHQRFRYWWDYSGGTLTDWGAHHNDIALWGLGKDLTGPVTIEGKATVEPIAGGYTAASQFQVRYVYDDGIEHLCRNTTANGRSGNIVGKPGRERDITACSSKGPRAGSTSAEETFSKPAIPPS